MEIGEWGTEGIRGFKYFLTQSALATAIDREVAAVGEAFGGVGRVQRFH